MNMSKEHTNLTRVCELQKIKIKSLENSLKQQQQKYDHLKRDLKQRQAFVKQNMQILQSHDQLKYELTQIKDYAKKLEEKLNKTYHENPEKLKIAIKKQIPRQASNKYPISTKNPPNQEESIIKLSSISIIDESFQFEKKGMSESISNIKSSSNNSQSKFESPSNLYVLSQSDVKMTQSEMRLIEGSTSRIQHELSQMEMQLYEVKAEMNLHQQKYQTECNAHKQTKIKLLSLQEKYEKLQNKFQKMSKQSESLIQQLKKQSQQLTKQNNQLRQKRKPNQQLARQDFEQKLTELRKQIFKLKQAKEEQEYQLNITVKQQKIELQTLRETFSKQSLAYLSFQKIFASAQQKIQLFSSQCTKIKQENLEIQQKNHQISFELNQCKEKQKFINNYLESLANEISSVHQIVWQKQTTEQKLNEKIDQTEQILQKRQTQILQLESKIQNLKMTLQNQQNELTMERIKFNCLQKSNQDSSEGLKFTFKSQNQQKLLTLQKTNQQLLQKNKELVTIVNKNAQALISYEKAKKQISHLNSQIFEVNSLKTDYQTANQIKINLEKENLLLKETIKQLENRHQSNINLLKSEKDKIQLQLSKQLQKNNQIYQKYIIELKNLSIRQIQISQKSEKINQLQIKVSKLQKQKKHLEQAKMLVEQKNKRCHSLILQELAIQKNKSLIKNIEQKNNKQAMHQEMKTLFPQMQYSKKKIKSKSQKSTINQANVSKNSKTQILISMIQSFLTIQKRKDFNFELKEFQQKIKQEKELDKKLSSWPALKFLIDKASQALKELAIYKTKLLKQNQFKTKNLMIQIITAIQPLENSIQQIIKTSKFIYSNQGIYPNEPHQ